MAWSDGKQPVNPPQQQTKTQLISELADENSQLYELLNEQKKRNLGFSNWGAPEPSRGYEDGLTL